jgi:hypothetical protein
VPSMQRLSDLWPDFGADLVTSNGLGIHQN